MSKHKRYEVTAFPIRSSVIVEDCGESVKRAIKYIKVLHQIAGSTTNLALEYVLAFDYDGDVSEFDVCDITPL
jgi:hypothetical protein